MKKIFLIICLFLSFNLSAQIVDSAECITPMGQVFADSCTTYAFSPVILSGQTATKCFTIQPTIPGGLNLSYILLNSTCGPFAPYNSLTFNMYNSTCDTLLESGEIFPASVNTFINPIDTAVTYTICFTWTALCDQYTVCPTIKSSPLPVELIAFYGESESNANVIYWITASELNNNFFQIQQSKDAKSFKVIGTVDGSATTNQAMKYSYVDVAPHPGNTYYQLIQVDFDGNSTPSYIIVVNNAQEKGNLLYTKIFNLYSQPVNLLNLPQIYYVVNYYNNSVEVFKHINLVTK